MKDKILSISKELKLTHIGSCISVLPILEEIYSIKKLGDKVLLDNAHAHLAHALFIISNPKESIEEYGIHCDRRAGCDASGGSLGHALGFGIGMALIDPTRDVYVVVSDGSMMEGSNWEALRIKYDLKIDNLKIYCNFNGYSAVSEVNVERLVHRMRTFCSDTKVFFTDNGVGFEGIGGHYKLL